jgi:hypothetical protein
MVHPGDEMERIPLETQTLYAEFLEQLIALEAQRSLGHLSGCFTRKEVKGETYFYFQYSEPGGVSRQVYVGKKTPSLERMVERFAEDRDSVSSEVGQIQRLCAQLRAGGALVTDATSSRVLKALADGGVFRFRGVLVGTHAFAVLGNVLGVRWKGGSLRTQDLDIAGPLGVAIALPMEPEADVPSILEGLQMGFLPIPVFDPKHPSTSFKVRGKALRVDFLTTMTRRNVKGPVYLPRLRTAALPLKYIDYLVEEPIRAGIVNGGGILVQVPSPERFGLHKLIVSQERAAASHTKVEKDLLQAAQILSIVAEERAGDLGLAWTALEDRGRSWVRQAKKGLTALEKEHEAEHAVIARALGLRP